MKVKNIKFAFKRWHENEGHIAIVKYILGIILNICFAVFSLVIASQIVKIIETSSNTEEILGKSLLVIIGFALVMMLAKIIGLSVHMSTFLYRIMESPNLISKLMKLPFSSIEGKEGKQDFEKALRAVGEGNEIGVEAIIKNLMNLLIGIGCLLILSLISIRLSPWIVLVLLISGLARILVDHKNREWLKKTMDARNSHYYNRYYLQRECLDPKNGKDIRIYKMEDWFSEKSQEEHDHIMRYEKQETTNRFKAELIQHTASFLRDIFCYGFLIYNLSEGLAISDFVLYLGVIGGYNSWINEIYREYSGLCENAIIVDEFRRYLQKEEFAEGTYDEEIPLSDSYEYVFDNVSFAYDDGGNVLEDFNLRIKAGEHVALVGENGAGKSTLVKLMCGLYQPQKGRILLNGVDIAKVNPKELLEYTGVVFQETKVFPESIARNISCELDENIDDMKLIESIEMANLGDFIGQQKHGVSTILTKHLDLSGIEMSGGQYQKLMLARAIYKDAPILVLDEPTSALDPLAEADMYQKYYSLTKDKTSVFISHRLSSTQFCDRVIYMEDGKIKQDGTHDELLKINGPYKTMFEAQAHYYQEEVELCVS